MDTNNDKSVCLRILKSMQPTVILKVKQKFGTSDVFQQELKL